MNIPENLHYVETHEWLRVEGDTATVGITDHAQHELTDVVYVELPAVGRKADAQAAVAAVESVKAASDIYLPVGGEILAVNDQLQTDPGLVNSDPYGAGWLFKIKVVNSAEVSKLMDAKGYAGLIAAHAS